MVASSLARSTYTLVFERVDLVYQIRCRHRAFIVGAVDETVQCGIEIDQVFGRQKARLSSQGATALWTEINGLGIEAVLIEQVFHLVYPLGTDPAVLEQATSARHVNFCVDEGAALSISPE